MTIEERIRNATGYGTLGHLVAVLLDDREIHNGNAGVAMQVIDNAIEHADALWDGVIGPMLDRLEGELL